MGWGNCGDCFNNGDDIMELDDVKLDKVVLIQQLRLYVIEKGEHSFEGRYAELLIDMLVSEIEKKK